MCDFCLILTIEYIYFLKSCCNICQRDNVHTWHSAKSWFLFREIKLLGTSHLKTMKEITGSKSWCNTSALAVKGDMKARMSRKYQPSCYSGTLNGSGMTGIRHYRSPIYFLAHNKPARIERSQIRIGVCLIITLVLHNLDHCTLRVRTRNLFIGSEHMG